MSIQQLPLTSRAASPCSCCTPASEARTAPPAARQTSRVEDYGLLGLTCGGCASRVSSSLKKIDGVLDAQVTPVPGGVSTARVVSSRPLTPAEVEGAVSNAGYSLAAGDAVPARGASGCRSR